MRVPPLAYTASVFPRHFQPTPWRKVWKSTKGSLELEIYAIDSNAGLRGQRMNILARGSFSTTELARLERLLQESDSQPPPEGIHRVRAVVTHHSLSYAGGLFAAQQLEDASRDHLLDLAAKYRIVAVLTGHTHDFYLKPFLVPTGAPTREVYELRSATTLQGRGGIWPNKEQGFLAHQVWLDGDRPTWSVWRYRWDNSHQFVRWSDVPCLTFPVF